MTDAPIKQNSSLQDKQLEIDHLHSIINATRLINSTLDLDELMESIRTIARDELQAEKATIFLGNEENQELHSAYLEDTYLDINLTFGSGLAGMVAKTGKSIIIDDAQNDERFYKGVDEISGYVTKTVVCAPMYNKEQKLIGVFQVLNSKKGKFSE
ncbi:MAG: GAF domain-containing protein, partial [Candidatus Marinimicrobia bacterium]|nr:GAF domain-containing protein [Candidatus Neomarinimicrobiota bacterium]